MAKETDVDPLHTVNGVMAIICAFVLSIIVLNNAIKEGVLIKVGLVMMIFSLMMTGYHSLANNDTWRALILSGIVLRSGLLIVGLGFLFRRYRRGSWDAAMSNWGEAP